LLILEDKHYINICPPNNTKDQKGKFLSNISLVKLNNNNFYLQTNIILEPFFNYVHKYTRFIRKTIKASKAVKLIEYLHAQTLSFCSFKGINKESNFPE